MAALPGYVCIEQGGWSERMEPSVERVEMERGAPKERVLNSQVRAEATATLIFRSRADAIAFEDWYLDTIGRIGWFDMEHPLRGTTISVRFVGGDIGELVPRAPNFAVSSRQVRLEYMR